MDRTRAEENVARKFTRVMNATPAPWGILSDVTFSAATASVILAVGLAIASRASNGAGVIVASLALAAVPVVVTFFASIMLRGSRAVVVDWLASLPFPVENINAVLAGVADTIEVYFEELPPGASLPTRGELQPLLEAVSDDALMLGDRPDERLVEIKIGVVDSKRNPLRTNHERWERLLKIVSSVLVPLSEKLPIERIHVQ
jgi:hypothetical protein